jgi:activator of HSP90 ATPase
MSHEFRVSGVIPASSNEVYDAWLSSERHSAMTGGEAIIDPRVGGRFRAWDGYITGETLDLEPPSRIVQSWRSSQFRDDDADSRIEVTFVADGAATLLTIHHTSIPDGQDGYEEGWRENYLQPMVDYFSSRRLA